jgi:Domain of unknown function (DUF4333)
MPETEGPTCPACLTLNPVGAPACIRCNTPLPPAGPGSPAAPPRPTASDGAAAPVPLAARPEPGSRPPVGVEPPSPPPSAGVPRLTPPQQRRIARRTAVAGALLVLVVLAAGGTVLWLTRPHYLDTGAVANRIAEALTDRLGEPIAVECQGTPERRTGETFRCEARNARGYRQAVTVTVIDSEGRYRWQLGPATEPTTR